MRFKDLFDKEFNITEQVRKSLKIFYRIDIDLIKPNEEVEQPQQNTIQQSEQPELQQPETQQVDTQQQPEVQPVQQNNTGGLNPADIVSSVVTEDEAMVNSNDRVLRKFEDFDNGVELSAKEQDLINSFDDLLNKLSEIKKDGTDILDDFCVEIITLCANKNFNEIKAKIDKKSKLFVEIIYGYNKNDSVGVRFSKSANSDSISYLMLVDNKIISAPFDINKINQRIISLRNEKV